MALPHAIPLYGEHACPQPHLWPCQTPAPSMGRLLIHNPIYGPAIHGPATSHPPPLYMLYEEACLSTTPSMALSHASPLYGEHARPQPHLWPCQTLAPSMGSMLAHNPIHGPPIPQPPLWGTWSPTTPSMSLSHASPLYGEHAYPQPHPWPCQTLAPSMGACLSTTPSMALSHASPSMGSMPAHNPIHGPATR